LSHIVQRRMLVHEISLEESESERLLKVILVLRDLYGSTIVINILNLELTFLHSFCEIHVAN
jgi:hypothetical protein